MSLTPSDARVRFTRLLVAATMGVYALVVVGATTAITDAARSCTTWPACGGQWLQVSSLELAIVWGHRLTAVLVAVLVLATLAFAWRNDEPRRVQAAVAAAALLYPVQIGIGAFAAVTGTPATVSALHLVVGLGIFAGLVLALAWTLEAQTADLPSCESEPREGDADPDPAITVSGPVATAYAYFRLMKPRLMWLLCLVAGAGMALAAGPGLSIETVFWTFLGGVLSIGASGTFNHVLERDIDEKMNRTNDRPTVTDEVPVRNAVAWGVFLAAASVWAFLHLNLLAAGLGVAAILFYSVVYTLVLKPNTVQNTVIGGLAGALPALIGWAAVTNELGVPALALAGVIFLWTPAHFYNLALAYKDDYARGGFPMMPVVRGDAPTRKHIVYYLGATLMAAAVLAWVSRLGFLFAATSLGLGALFLWMVVRLHRERDRSAAMRAFHASNAYLGAVLVAVAADALLVI
ncbi:heme o synthase [Salarchaeum japonicum]|uniref:Protoheme IX farnesyltransferase n=1 Tax=Salarchaeum japonicum TaxID=555573 RepID=A0AAV3T2E1_9EURY